MYRPECWKEIKDAIHDKINIDDPYYEGEVDEGIEAGADAMLEKLRANTVSVLSYFWAADASDWADRNKGHLVFIPDEEE